MNHLGHIYVSLRDRYRAYSGLDRRPLCEAFPPRPPRSAWQDPTPDLTRLLEFARDNVPYYREVAGELPTTSLEQWPILSKQVLRSRYEDFKAPDWEAREVIENASGGSTGRPVRFLHERQFRERAKAVNQFYDIEFLGIDENASRVVLWNSPRDVRRQGSKPDGVRARLKDRMLDLMGMKSTTLHSFAMSEGDMDDYLHVINREKPDYILAYAGSLYQLARRAEERAITMHQPRKMTTTAETLQPFMRRCIESVFGKSLSDCYGSREVGLVAGEAADGRMYIFDFANHVEVVDDEGRQVAPGKEGRVLVTCLFNYAMPLIRYEIGDLAVWGEPAQYLGRTWPTLERVVGRSTEQFVTRDGGLVHGLFFVTRFYYRDWVDELEIVQREVNVIDVNFVARSTPCPKQMAEVEEEFRSAMGDDCVVNWNQLDVIPRTQEGKHLYTRSLVHQKRSTPAPQSHPEPRSGTRLKPDARPQPDAHSGGQERKLG